MDSGMMKTVLTVVITLWILNALALGNPLSGLIGSGSNSGG